MVTIYCDCCRNNTPAAFQAQQGARLFNNTDGLPITNVCKACLEKLYPESHGKYPRMVMFAKIKETVITDPSLICANCGRLRSEHARFLTNLDAEQGYIELCNGATVHPEEIAQR